MPTFFIFEKILIPPIDFGIILILITILFQWRATVTTTEVKFYVLCRYSTFSLLVSSTKSIFINGRRFLSIIFI
jgi:hypothetical protein